MWFRTSAAMFSAFAWALAATDSACSSEAEKPLTQLVLVADTNARDVKQVEFDFRSDGKETPGASKRTADIVAGTPLYFSLVYESGSISAPITVSASGLNAKGEVVVRRKAIVKYVRDQTRTVPLHLLKSCEADFKGEVLWKYCEKNGQTCTEKGCAALELKELDSWDQDRIPTISAGAADGGGNNDGGDTGSSSNGMSGSDGGSTSSGATNTGGTNTGGTNTGGTSTGGTSTGGTTGPANCDGIDLNTSVKNCGMCGKVCPVSANEEASCAGGICRVTCVIGYQDCSPGAGVNAGCERARIDTDTTCGPSCEKCVGGRTCVSGKCQ